MWCVASRPPRSSVVGFLEPDHPGSALGGLSAHDEHTSASSGESSASGQESIVVAPASRTSGAAASPKCSTPSVTPLASTVVMKPAPTQSRRGRAQRLDRLMHHQPPGQRRGPVARRALQTRNGSPLLVRARQNDATRSPSLGCPQLLYQPTDAALSG